MHAEESISLYYKNGGSNKEYHAQLKQKNAGFIVVFQYGRRGSTLQTGTKTQEPLPFDKAKKIYDKLVKSKVSKGYTHGESGTVYQDTEYSDRATGIFPQLLNPIENHQLDQYLNGDRYCAQEKHDGERGLTLKKLDGVTGINRKGLKRPLALNISQAFSECQDIVQCLVDGEVLDDRIILFDLLEYQHEDLRSLPYHDRLDYLSEVVHRINDSHVDIVHTVVDTESKIALFNELKAHGREGIVFKDLTAPYTEGKPNSHGPQVKYKFYKEASFIVMSVHDSKRSVGIGMLDQGILVNVGNVTIPVNKPIPCVNDIVDVRYLYAFKSGSIFQPVFRGQRTDLYKEDCVLTQLQYKNEAA